MISDIDYRKRKRSDKTEVLLIRCNKKVRDSFIYEFENSEFETFGDFLEELLRIYRMQKIKKV